MRTLRTRIENLEQATGEPELWMRFPDEDVIHGPHGVTMDYEEYRRRYPDAKTIVLQWPDVPDLPEQESIA